MEHKIELRIKKWIENNGRKITIVGHIVPSFSYPSLNSTPISMTEVVYIKVLRA
jgi:hypothetical protein